MILNHLNRFRNKFYYVECYLFLFIPYYHHARIGVGELYTSFTKDPRFCIFLYMLCIPEKRFISWACRSNSGFMEEYLQIMKTLRSQVNGLSFICSSKIHIHLHKSDLILRYIFPIIRRWRPGSEVLSGRADAFDHHSHPGNRSCFWFFFLVFHIWLLHFCALSLFI